MGNRGNSQNHVLLSEQNQELIQSQAKSWFSLSNKDFKLICEQAGTEADYILKLYDKYFHNIFSWIISIIEVYIYIYMPTYA